MKWGENNTMFKKGVVTNPFGNPNMNIGNERKTGPITDDGKFRQALSLLTDGKYSKMVHKMRVCSKCPLGQKNQTVKINGKEMERTIPAKCSYYMAPETEQGTKCIIPVQDFIDKCKIYYQIMKEQDTMALQEALIQQTIMDGMLARESEIITKGTPGFYTKEFSDLALRYTTELNKIKFGNQRQQHVHFEGDLAQQMVNKMFSNDEKEEEKKDDEKQTKDVE